MLSWRDAPASSQSCSQGLETYLLKVQPQAGPLKMRAAAKGQTGLELSQCHGWGPELDKAAGLEITEARPQRLAAPESKNSRVG
jgi:hypothetical protein